MRMILNKGHRIRASDKNLVYRFSMGTLLFVFVAVILLLNTKQLMRTDWEHFSLLDNPIFIKDGDNVKVKVAVKFIDNQTKATQVSQYELVLHKDSNWKIVG